MAINCCDITSMWLTAWTAFLFAVIAQKKANKHVSINTETRAALAARSEHSSHTMMRKGMISASLQERDWRFVSPLFPPLFLSLSPLLFPLSLACMGVGRGVAFWLIKLKGRLLFVGKNPIISPREAAEGERLLMALRRAGPNGHFRPLTPPPPPPPPLASSSPSLPCHWLSRWSTVQRSRVYGGGVWWGGVVVGRAPRRFGSSFWLVALAPSHFTHVTTLTHYWMPALIPPEGHYVSPRPATSSSSSSVI